MAIFDKLFKRNKENKEVQYAYNYQYGNPKWSTQKDEEYITEAYNKIIWVYACIDKIATCVASVPFCLYRYRNGEKIEIEQHPILDMVNKQINPYMTSSDFFEMWATYLAIQGKFYALKNNERLPTQLEYLYPHKTKIIPSRENVIQGYEYYIDERKYIYGRDEVLWSKFNDPLSYYEGQSPIRAMARTVDTENSTIDWNKNTLDNSAVPAGIIQVMNPSPELQNKLRYEWQQRYGGSKNARVPLVLDAEKASYQNLGFSPIDMDFILQRKLSRIEICAGFGVPSQVVGDPEGQTYSNYAEALKAFWENTIIPKYLKKIEQALNLNVVSKYADNLVLEYNLDGVEALHESIDAISERTNLLWEKGVITRNEARFALGYEDVEDGDLFVDEIRARQFSSLTSTPQDTPEDDTEDTSEEEEESKKKESKALNMNKDQQFNYWKKFEREREQFYEQGEKALKKIFRQEQKEIKKIKADNQNELINKTTQIIDNNKEKYQKALLDLYLKTMTYFGEKTERDIFANVKSQTVPERKFDVFDDILTQWIIENVAEKVVMVTDTTKNQIKNIVQVGQESGESIPEIASRIDSLYLDQIIPNRSAVIARTEVIGSSNQASLESATQTGLDLRKIWIPTMDDRTRDSHLKMAEHPPIELDQMFDVGTEGVKLNAPSDPNGIGDEKAVAAEVINCRCALGYVSAEGEEV